MAETTDTYIKSGSKWALQSYQTYTGTNEPYSPNTSGTASGNYPRKANYFWYIAGDVWCDRPSGYGSGTANNNLSARTTRNNQSANGGTGDSYTWRRLVMNTSNHGDNGSAGQVRFNFDNNNDADVSFFVIGSDGRNYEATNNDSIVHEPDQIWHVITSGDGDGSGNAPKIIKLMGKNPNENPSNGANGAGMQFYNSQGGSQNGSVLNFQSCIISPPTPPNYIYPNLKNGSTFLTSNTNKLYMWNGTDTWNEVS